MQRVTLKIRSLKDVKACFSGAVFLLLLFVSCLPAEADTIIKDYEYPEDTVRVIDVTESLNNRDDYIISLLGIPDIPSLSISYMPGLYGIWSQTESDSDSGKIITNTGNFDITINGGSEFVSSHTTLYGAGIYSEGPSFSYDGNGILNTGTLHLTGKGVDAGRGEAETAYTYLYGISGWYIGDITNYGDIEVQAEGGTAFPTEGSGSTGTSAYGIYGQYIGDIINSGRIEVRATGGVIDGSAAPASDTWIVDWASASAYAYGISSPANKSATVNSGDIRVIAAGGTAISSNQGAESMASATGISHSADDLTNSGEIVVTAAGGTATTTNETSLAYADASGIYAWTRGGI